MTATAQRILSGDMGQRLVFIAEILNQGEIPDADKQPLSRQELETLRRIAYMLAQAMAATAQSMEAQVGLISLSKSVTALARSLGRYNAERSLGVQAKEIRENARDVRQGISDALQRLSGMKDDNGLKQTLLAGLSQLKDLESKGKEGSRIVRLVTLRDKAAISPALAAKITLEGKTAGARVIPFNKAATQPIQTAERMVPSKPSPLNRSNVTGKVALSVLTKTELKKGAIPAKELTGKSDPASRKASGLVPVDKKPFTPLTTQKDNSPVEVKRTSMSAGTKTVASSIANTDVKKAVTDKTLSSPNAKTAEGKTEPTNAVIPDAKVFMATTAVDGKAALAGVTSGSKIIASATGINAIGVRAKTVQVRMEPQAIAQNGKPPLSPTVAQTVARTTDAGLTMTSENKVLAAVQPSAKTTESRIDFILAGTTQTKGIPASTTQHTSKSSEPPHPMEVHRAETPSTDTFRTVTPRSMTPQNEARVEISYTEFSAEVPRSDAKTETSRPEISKVETPRTETSRAEAPHAESPGAEAPRVAEPQRHVETLHSEVSAEAPQTESLAQTTRAEAISEMPRSETAAESRAEIPTTEIRTEAPHVEALKVDAKSPASALPEITTLAPEPAVPAHEEKRLTAEFQEVAQKIIMEKPAQITQEEVTQVTDQFKVEGKKCCEGGACGTPSCPAMLMFSKMMVDREPRPRG